MNQFKTKIRFSVVILCIALVFTWFSPTEISAEPAALRDVVDVAESLLSSEEATNGEKFLRESEIEAGDIEWSCAFVLYCASHSTVDYIEQNIMPSSIDITHAANWFKNNGLWIPKNDTYLPQRGDIAFFTCNDASASGRIANHIGIVHHADAPDRIYVIEGCSTDESEHTSPSVCLNMYSYSESDKYQIVGFGSPQYQVAEDAYLQNLSHDANIEYLEAENISIIYDFLLSELNFSKAAACGAIGNILQESKGYADIIEYGYTWDNGGGYGIIQWTNTNGNGRTSEIGVTLSSGDTFFAQPGLRRTNLVNFCTTHGLDFRTLEGQLYFLKWELETYDTYRTGIQLMQTCPNTDEGAVQACGYWLKFIEGAGDENGALYQNTFYPRAQYTRAAWLAFTK